MSHVIEFCYVYWLAVSLRPLTTLLLSRQDAQMCKNWRRLHSLELMELIKLLYSPEWQILFFPSSCHQYVLTLKMAPTFMAAHFTGVKCFVFADDDLRMFDGALCLWLAAIIYSHWFLPAHRCERWPIELRTESGHLLFTLLQPFPTLPRWLFLISYKHLHSHLFIEI